MTPTMLEKFFPLAHKRNVLIFHIATIVDNNWFIAANWIFFWTRYMSFAQLGVIDSLAFGLGLFLDIPTGAIADLIGKKKTVVAAFLCSCIGVVVIASASSVWPIFIGWLIVQLGWSL